jgi:hypothetical protein
MLWLFKPVSTSYFGNYFYSLRSFSDPTVHPLPYALSPRLSYSQGRHALFEYKSLPCMFLDQCLIPFGSDMSYIGDSDSHCRKPSI